MAVLLYALAALFALVGGVLTYSGLMIDPTIPSGVGTVANLQLLFTQLNTLVLGAGSIITAATCLIGGATVEAIKKRGD